MRALCPTCGLGPVVAKGECLNCYRWRRRYGTARPAARIETQADRAYARMGRR